MSTGTVDAKHYPAASDRARGPANAGPAGRLAAAGVDEHGGISSGIAGPAFAAYNEVGGATEGPDVLIGTPLDDHIPGLGGDDQLFGLAGPDLLDGGTGVDTMTGGDDNDKFVVDNTGDIVVEVAGGGTDSISTLVDYQLAAGSHVERLNAISWAMTTHLSLTGNEFVNLIEGNAGNNLLDGRGGADRMIGFAGIDQYVVDDAADVVVELAGGGQDIVSAVVDYQLAPGTSVEKLIAINAGLTTPLKLTGNNLVNRIEGNAGNNTLDGRGGADSMVGFGGNDIYIVDNAADQVIENANGGNDVVYALTDYSLAGQASAAVERLAAIDRTLTTPLSLSGSFGNTLVEGNRGDNRLDGGAGGFDKLVGFEGDDVYWVFNPFTIIVEAAGEGYDTVLVSGTDLYQLGPGVSVERLKLRNPSEDAAVRLIGNEISNLIEGATGHNFIDGRGGADVMIGKEGSDTYVVENLGDQVIETVAGIAEGGRDTIYTHVDFHLSDATYVEVLSAVDFTLTNPINLSGNSQQNEINGNAGANRIDGRGGSDTLRGHDGDDIFAFTTALGAGNVDTIRDFVADIDEIQLDDAVFAGLSPGVLPAAALATGTAATDADDRIIYDTATGRLFFDADGNGSASTAVHFATLTGAPEISFNDFAVI